ncbi:MAG: mucoidy inhibitor MuiA family protein [Ignavibacteria bacterium]|nr:mucoidy inhibitor MuiA family protein [Ignavibacteria bacterium]
MLQRTVCLLVFIPLLLQAQTGAPSTHQAVNSIVSAVAVYPDRAMVTRTIKDQLPSGERILVVGDLPTTLIDQTIRVSGAGESAVKILDVSVATVFLDTIPEVRIRDLQSRLRSLRVEEQKLQDALVVLRSQREFVDSVKISTSREARPSGVQRATLEEWDRLLAFLEKKLGGIFAEMRATNQSLIDLRSKIETVEREIRNSQAYSRKSQKQIHITVNSTTSGRVQMSVSYVVPGAVWYPAYEARVSSNSQIVQFVYAGQVKQNTGEDWANVELTLSTARPSEGGLPSELTPWYVDVFLPPPPVVAGALRRKDAAAESKMTDEITVSRERMEMELPVAEVESQGASVIFRVPVRATIPSDNSPHKVTVGVFDLPVEMKYLSIPKNSPAAFMTGSIKNATEYPFLSGAVNLFFENTFVASSPLKRTMAGESFDVGLGIDDRVKTQRKLQNRFTEYTGTFTRKTKITYDYLISIENTRKESIHIEVRDQIPLSRNERIVVEVIAPSPKEMKPEADGSLRWKLNLTPGEKKLIPLKFSIEYPSDLNVVGVE